MHLFFPKSSLFCLWPYVVSDPSLSLSWLTSPFAVFSPPHPTRAEEWVSGCVVLCCQPGLNHNNIFFSKKDFPLVLNMTFVPYPTVAIFSFFARRYWWAMAPVSQFSLSCGWRILGMNDVGELRPKSEEVPQRSVRFCSWAAPCSVRWVQMDRLEAH